MFLASITEISDHVLAVVPPSNENRYKTQVRDDSDQVHTLTIMQRLLLSTQAAEVNQLNTLVVQVLA